MKIYSVGGFSEVGKNMVVIELEKDAFILDMGFYLPAIVSMEERDRIMTKKKLRSVKAIPNDDAIQKIKSKVRAIFVGHAHLDHVGAVPFLANDYNAPVYSTPFTAEVLKSLIRDNNIDFKNKIYPINVNTSFYIKGNKQKYKVDFINITHSIPQSLMIAIHTEDGIVLYANDFKLDDTPVLGLKPNYKRLRELAQEKVKVLIVDSLYSGSERKTPSEKIARVLLQEVLLTIQNQDAGMIVTTFSSHIARLKSIVEFGNKLNREIVFLGRSLEKYSRAAKNVGIAPFLKNVKILTFRKRMEKALAKINKKKNKYLIVCTGHQGEPGSILERISRNQLPLRIEREDNIVFSSSVIPTPINKEQFAKMEARLKKKKPRIFRDVHVSGHAGREDLRDILKIVNPEHIIPSHGGIDKTLPMVNLAEELGYKNKKNIHLMRDGKFLKL